MADPEQIALLTATLRSAAGEPVIAIDEEGGDVTRVTYWSGSLYPGNAALGAIDDPGLTTQVHEAIGTDLATLGINVDLAPCVDVLDGAENPAIGTRSFGADPALVSRHAAAAVTGLQSAGVAACAKHFPGHGSMAITRRWPSASCGQPAVRQERPVGRPRCPTGRGAGAWPRGADCWPRGAGSRGGLVGVAPPVRRLLRLFRPRCRTSLEHGGRRGETVENLCSFCC